MTTYTKQIEITSTGMVIAKVFSQSGRRVGLEFFNGFLFNSPKHIESRAKRAHVWADEMIAVCQRQEVGAE